MCKHIVDISHAVFPNLWKLERPQTAKVTFKLIQCHP